MRGVRLDDLVTDLRAEIGHSTNPSVGINARDYLVQVLRRTQDRLWEEYDWAHLKVSRDIVLQAGQRYYSVPVDLHYERIVEVGFKYGDTWHKLGHGIDERCYSTYDSDRDERSWPVAKWDVAEDTGAVDDIGVIEVWPMPSRSTTATDGTLRLTGFRRIQSLVEGGDKCELDGTLIVLMAASEIQARQNQGDAQFKLQQAQQLLSRLMNQNSNKKKSVSFTDTYDDCDGFRPRMVGSVTSLGSSGGGTNPPTEPEGPPYDLSQNYLNDLLDVNAIPSDGWVLTWDASTSRWVGGLGAEGVEEAPQDGNQYARKDGEWSVIASVTGDYLPRDGSLPMEGNLDLWHMETQGVTQTWYEDGGVTPRMRMSIDSAANNRAELAFYTADGNDIEGRQLISIRSETNTPGTELKSGVVLQASQANGQENFSYTGIIGFNKIDTADDYAQFAIQGLNADNTKARRDAWLGTGWDHVGDDYAQPSDPGGRKNIQLYIRRPTRGDVDFLYFGDRVSNFDALRFRVNNDGILDAAGGARFGGRVPQGDNPWRQEGGSGLEVGYFANQTADGLAGGVIQVKNRDGANDVFEPMFLYASEFHFNTSDATDTSLREATIRVWKNPDTPTEDEFALLDKIQLRIYRDLDGNTRSFETIGNGETANGWRIINYNTDTSAITAAAQQNGLNFLNVNGEYRLNGQKVFFVPGTASQGDTLRWWNGAWEANKALQLDNTNNSEVLRIQPNQYVSGVDELALRNDAQLRSYTATGQRQWETFGEGSSAHGMRIVRADGVDAGAITLAAQTSGINFIDVTGATGKAEYRIYGRKLAASDIGAAPVNHTHTGYVQTGNVNQNIAGTKVFTGTLNVTGNFQIDGQAVTFVPVGTAQGQVLRWWSGAWQVDNALTLENTNQQQVVKLRPNPYQSGTDELALMNDAQMRSYDAGGNRQWETFGEGSNAHGMRVVRADGASTAAITLAARTSGSNTINIEGTSPQYQINGAALNAGHVGAATAGHGHSNYVTTNTSQTVSGQKTFSSLIVPNGGINGPSANMVMNAIAIFVSGGGASALLRRDTIQQLISDERLKENVEYLDEKFTYASPNHPDQSTSSFEEDSVLAKVRSMETFLYDLKDGIEHEIRPYHARRYGLSAQQIQLNFPEAVHHLSTDRDDDGSSISGEDLLGADYADLVPILIKAIQEMSTKMDEAGLL